MRHIKIIGQSDDAPEFITRVEALLNGAAHRYKPPGVQVVKINNWFSEKWFRFSGKSMGVIPMYNYSWRIIPPFVPNRVVWQRAFRGPEFEEVEPGPPLHKALPSTRAQERVLAEPIGRGNVMWFSGNSAKTGRGAVMFYGVSYGPDRIRHQTWYTGWTMTDGWRLTVMQNIKKQELQMLFWDAFDGDSVEQQSVI